MEPVVGTLVLVVWRGRVDVYGVAARDLVQTLVAGDRLAIEGADGVDGAVKWHKGSMSYLLVDALGYWHPLANYMGRTVTAWKSADGTLRGQRGPDPGCLIPDEPLPLVVGGRIDALA